MKPSIGKKYAIFWVQRVKLERQGHLKTLLAAKAAPIRISRNVF